MGDTPIALTATIHGGGHTPDQIVSVIVEDAHTGRDGYEHAAAFVSGDAQLDAAGLRRLAAACLDAADQLDDLTRLD